MIDAASIVDGMLAITAAVPDQKAAAAIVEPQLDALRAVFRGMEFDGRPKVRTLSPPSVSASEKPAVTSDRLARRVEELHLAKSYGTAEDVERVIDQAVEEIRFAVLSRLCP